jgi:predicted RNA-binding protein
MNIRRIRIGLLFLIIIVAVLFYYVNNLRNASPKGQLRDMPNVIVITLSGVRDSESIDDLTHQYVPNLWGKMLKEGTLYTNLVSLGAEFHMPQVDAINTGKDYPIYIRIDTPSIFQYVRKKYGLSATKFWSVKHFVEKSYFFRTEELRDDTFPCEIDMTFTMSEELKSKLTKQELNFIKSFRQMEAKFMNFEIYHWDTVDEIFCGIFKKIVDVFKPKLIHYVMAGVEVAHHDMFSRYCLALKHSDQNIFQIWQMIQRVPFYRDNTYLIVCPDHERNDYYMQHTQNAHDNPSRVWMYIYGPKVKKGAVIRRRINHVDIFATLAYIFKVDTKPSKGKILKDCFI